MEYTLDAFFNSLITQMGSKFPYMQNSELDRRKHPNREPLHLRDAIMNSIVPIHSFNSITFDIGSDVLETTHPYYHILEDSQVIRKRGKGTTKSRGSQAKVQDVGSRDYGRVSWNGKTFTKEYAKNVRGSRSLIGKSSRWVDNKFINREANYYENIHYHYIENMLNNGILDMLAQEFGLKRVRTQSTGLEEEFMLQESMDYGTDNASSLLDIFHSFE